MKFTIQILSCFILAIGVMSCASEKKTAENSEKAMSERAVIAMESDSVGTSAASHRLTADDQARASKANVELTRQIRERLMQDDRLSVYAQNITIVTLDDTVTLKGEVKSKEEGRKVARIARQIAKNKLVDNQLIITK